MTPARSPEAGCLPACLTIATSATDGEASARWLLSEDRYALPLDPEGERSEPAARAAIVDFEQRAVEIVSGVPARSAEELPVYQLEGGPTIAVATGRLFVRLSEDLSAEEYAPLFAELGLAIEDVPAYAPHCAWVAPSTGRAADGLKAAASLAALDGVEHAEPQLLRVAHRRQRSK